MTFKSISQAGQDLFVYKLLVEIGTVPIDKLTFLDIGCGGLEISNTYALEQLGARGWLVDNSQEAINATVGRPSRIIQADAAQYDYSCLPENIDYLSVDIDGGSALALERAINHRYRVITVEHDSYRFGDTLRIPIIGTLTSYGYDILCADVCNPWPFEAWAVMPGLVDMKIAEKFRRSEQTQWEDILGVKYDIH